MTAPPAPRTVRTGIRVPCWLNRMPERRLKGGVGKSLVTGLMAVNAQRAGFQTAILDADVTGPSVPKMFGIHDKAMGTDTEIYPLISKTGIKTMSLNNLLEDETSPVVWRGPRERSSSSGPTWTGAATT